MIDEDPQSRIDRLKAVYRDFFAEFSLLNKKKDRILQAYEMQLDEKKRSSLRKDIDQTYVWP